MSYTKLTDYAAKDALLSGNPSKVIRGTEIGADFDAVAAADALNLKTADGVTRVAQQNATYITLTNIAGTDTITADATPALTGYMAWQTFRFLVANTNTGAVTINIDGQGAKSITKEGATALAGGDLVAGTVVQITYDGTRFQAMGGIGSAGAGATGGGAGDAQDLVFFENDTHVTQNWTIGQDALKTCTIAIVSPAVITQTNNYVAGQRVRFRTTGALPTGITVNGEYYVLSTGLSTSSFQISLTDGGAAINTSGTQSGIHTCGKIKNAMSKGRISIASGVSVTIPSGSTWGIS
jgi:hypothetical protein